LDRRYPLKFKLAWWRRGFLADSASIYDFPRQDPRDYFSDYARARLKVNPLPEFFNQKLWLRTFLLSRGFPQAETMALVQGGNVQLQPLSAHSRLSSPAELEQWLLDDGGTFIMKPHDGTRGYGVFVVERQAGVLVRRRGRQILPFHHPARTGVKIIERMIEQGSFWRELSPASTNSLRVLTMWEPGASAPFIGCAVQRMGTIDTAPTDNWSAGGICAKVELESGRLGPGRRHSGAGIDTRFTHHPDTGAPIEGVIVPAWDKVKDTVLRAAMSLVTNRYVGWDVVVNIEGTPMILEGNNNSDVNLMQVHGGLLADPRVRRFYEQVGVDRSRDT
jgi:hypothetical protein